jgi:hypothetical protein
VRILKENYGKQLEGFYGYLKFEVLTTYGDQKDQKEKIKQKNITDN